MLHLCPHVKDCGGCVGLFGPPLGRFKHLVITLNRRPTSPTRETIGYVQKLGEANVASPRLAYV